MPLNFFEGLEILLELFSLGSSSKSSSDSEVRSHSRKSKHTTELWSGGFLVMASILYL